MGVISNTLDSFENRPSLEDLAALFLRTGVYFEQTRSSKLDWQEIKALSEYLFSLLSVIPSSFNISKEDEVNFIEAITKLYGETEELIHLRQNKFFYAIAQKTNNLSLSFIWVSDILLKGGKP